jgi:hypothetical protein
VHKNPPEYTITEENMTLVAERFQDREVKEFEEAQHKRDQIQDELANLK